WLIDTDLDAANGNGTVMSPRYHNVTVMESQNHIIDSTNLCRAFDNCVEDRLHVRRRATNNAEHLRRCRLMLQCLAQFCVELLEFFEQPHVLDGDDRLVSEGLEKRNLFVRKWPDFCAAD